MFPCLSISCFSVQIQAGIWALKPCGRSTYGVPHKIISYMEVTNTLNGVVIHLVIPLCNLEYTKAASCPYPLSEWYPLDFVKKYLQ